MQPRKYALWARFFFGFVVAWLSTLAVSFHCNSIECVGIALAHKHTKYYAFLVDLFTSSIYTHYARYSLRRCVRTLFSYSISR